MKKKLRVLILVVMLVASQLFIQEAFAATCPRCGKSMVDISEGDGPTCTSAGAYFYLCPSCGYEKVVKAKALGHNYKEEVIKYPSCTANGKAEYTCTRCGDHYTGTLKALGHSYEEETLDPTCTEDGKITHTCTRCQYSYEDILPALGHSFEVIEDSEPTCTEAGVHTERCSTCGEEETTLTDPLGHSFIYEVTDPTCTANGSKLAHCTVCGEEEEEILPATGHSFGEWVTTKEPGLYQEGEMTRTCEKGDAVEHEALPAKDPGGKITAIIGGGLALLGAAVGFAVKWLPSLKIARKADKIVDSVGGKPSLRMHTVILCLDQSAESKALTKCLKRKRFLNVKKPAEYAAEVQTAETAEGGEKKPELISLVLFNASSEEDLNSRLAELQEQFPNSDFGVLAEGELTEEQLKDREDLTGYAFKTDKTARQFFRLIGPGYKPDAIGDEYAANATLITAALGLPILTIVLNAFVVGSDVKDAVEVKGMSKADVADLVNDAAALFGLDGLADTADVIRKGLEKGGRLVNKKKMKDQEASASDADAAR